MRADDDAATDAGAGDTRKRFSHERRGLADRNDTQRPAVQPRSDLRILDGTIDEAVWRRGFNRAARDGQKMLFQ
jgi:hypothetical protein